MTQALKIDFVSDIVCPWCVIGLKALEQALSNLSGVVAAELHFQPFELNPDMPAAGQDIAEHVAQKYGASAEQSAANRDGIRARAAELGFEMAMAPGSRIWNTFDAHRLIHWAEEVGGLPAAHALKMALFSAHFTDGKNVSAPEILCAVAEDTGLDAQEAAAVLATNHYAADVREAEERWRRQGVNAVPAIIINDRYIISGGQPVEKFERALRSIASEMAATA